MGRKTPTRIAAWTLALLALGAAPLAAQRLAPQISTAPHHPGFRDAGAGTATLGYAAPAYVSRDQPRSAGLFYTSGQAAPLGFVQVDATDASGDAPQRMTIQVVNPWGSAVTPELSFAAGSGASRLAATWDASSYTSGALVHTVIVRSYWADGTMRESSAGVRVVIVNEAASPFGAGWAMAGLQRLSVQSDGVFALNGDGSGSFFATCAGCGFTSPEGDFSTLAVNAGGGYTRSYPDGSRVVFLASGVMSYRENRLGERDTYAWGSTPGGVSVPLSLTDPIGKQITFGYTGGYLTSITDPGGRVSQVQYSGTDVYRIVRPDNRAEFTATYAGHQLGGWNDAAGGRWDVAYDRGGALSSVTAPQVATTDAGATRPVTLLHSLMDAVLVQPGYGSGGQPASPRVLPANVRVSASDPRGNVVRAMVDRYGAPTRVEEPYGRVTVIDRNAHGQVTRTVSPTGHTTTATWNGVELTQVVDQTVHDSATTDYEHTWHQPTYVRHGLQRDSAYYNAAGVLDSTVSLGGGTRRTQRYSYWPDGRLYAVTDPEGHGSFYSYEGAVNGKLDNLVAVETGVPGYSTNRVTQYAHDALGRDTMVTSPNGDRSRVAYDALNRVVRSTDPLGNSTAFAFDSLGLASVTDAKSQVYRFARNALGWVVSETDPRNASSAYQYDRAGNGTGFTNRRGQTVSLSYDSLNRAVTRNAAGAVTTWSYDPAGLWSQAANAESTDRAEFDAGGRLQRTIVTRGANTYRLENALDVQGRRTMLSVAGPWLGTYGMATHYDDRSQPDTVVDFGGGRTVMGYDGDGLWTGPVLPMNSSFGFWISRSYVSTHVPAQIAHPPAVADVLNTSYSLNKNGLLAARGQRFSEYYAIGTRVTSYTYDRLGQLTKADVNEFYDSDGAPCTGVEPNMGRCMPSTGTGIPYWVEQRTYAWDAAGNPVGTNFTVENGNRLARTNPFNLEYDADGNLTRKYRTDQFAFDQRLFWNALGQLDSVRTNGTTVRYGYDGLGQRIRAGTKQFLYDGDDLLMELNAQGQPDRAYTYYPGVDNPHSVRLANGATYYYSTDFPGNVVALINKNRQIVARYTYDDFGHMTVEVDSTGGQPLRYAARELDAATGLYYVRARWYDPDMTRFVSEDPIGLAGGLNLFAYVGNNPVNGRDPSGLDPCRDENGNKVKQGTAQDCAVPLFPLDVTNTWTFGTPIDSGWSTNYGGRGGGTSTMFLPRIPPSRGAAPRVRQHRASERERVCSFASYRHAAFIGGRNGAAAGAVWGAAVGGMIGYGGGTVTGGLAGTLVGAPSGIGAVVTGVMGAEGGGIAGGFAGAWIGAHEGFVAWGVLGASGNLSSQVISCWFGSD